MRAVSRLVGKFGPIEWGIDPSDLLLPALFQRGQ